MYPCRDIDDKPLSVYTKNGEAEILEKNKPSNPPNETSKEHNRKSYSDGDLDVTSLTEDQPQVRTLCME